MASNSPNLKVNVGADTSQFTAGMKKAKSEMRAFENVSKDAMSQLAGAFGVPLGKLQQMSDALKGAATQAEKTGSKGASALKSIANAAGGAGVAIAAMGIGAAVTAFKLLNDEAENFRNTWNGMELAAGLDAYVRTYTQTFHDLNAVLGSSTLAAGAELKKSWTGIWTGLKNSALQILVGGKGMGEALADSMAKGAVADAAAGVAEQYAKQLATLQKQWTGTGMNTAGEGLQTQLSRLGAQIEELRLSARYAEDANDKLKALDETQDLINKKYNLQIGYQKQVAALTREIANLASSTPEQMQAAANEETKLLELEKQRNAELRSLSRERNTAVKAIQAEADARAKAEAEALQASIDTSVADLTVQVTAELDEESEALLQETLDGLELDPIQVPVELLPNVEQINTVFVELDDAVRGLAEDMAESVGSLIGDLTTGGDAWTNFGQSAVNALADMAIKIGKLAMASGTAALALEQLALDPAAAIAAGAALVALGAAAKTAMSNIVASKSSYAADASVASSAYATSPAITGVERSITIDVTGTLKADGNALVAVLNNEANRRYYTT